MRIFHQIIVFSALILALSGCGDIRSRSDDVQSVLVTGISQYSKDKEKADLTTIPHAYFDAALFRELLPKFKKTSEIWPPKDAVLAEIKYSDGRKTRLLLNVYGASFRVLGKEPETYVLQDPGRRLGYEGPNAERWRAELLRAREAISVNK